MVVALTIGISGFVYSFFSPGAGSSSQAANATAVLGTGGGYDLRPPSAERAKVYSLSARVLGNPTLRRGPGTQYAPVQAASDGQEFHVIACSPGCEWLRIFTLGDDGQWWLPANFLSLSGDVKTLPVLTPTDNFGR